jgi:hypothetical protein
MKYTKTFEDFKQRMIRVSKFDIMYNKLTNVLIPLGIGTYNFNMSGQSFNITQNLLEIPGSITSCLLKINAWEYYKEDLSQINYDQILYNNKKINYTKIMESNAGERLELEPEVFYFNFLTSLYKSIEEIKENRGKIRISAGTDCFMPDICDIQIDYIKNNLKYDQEIIISDSNIRTITNKLLNYPYNGLILNEMEKNNIILFNKIKLSNEEKQKLKLLNQMGFDD